MPRERKPTGFEALSVVSPGDVFARGLIGRGLASVYADVLREPLPEHLQGVVRRLDERFRATERRRERLESGTG